jgi:predicted Rossmann-fold nucleotide-binding protein
MSYETDRELGNASTQRVAHAAVRPLQTLDLLSQREMASLANADAKIHELFRRCALAILNTDGAVDDARRIYDAYADFEVQVVPEARGLKLELRNAPGEAFVDGRMIAAIRGHLFSALRDIVFTEHKLAREQAFDLSTPEGVTDAVFRILRNADVVRSNLPPRMIVCWGGHSIPRHEYDYSKTVGYSLGLRGYDICTGCGAGAMKGPMKGAAIAHAKQLNRAGRFLGVSEPGIIAAESPNAIVNELVILPDIEKRLEAFVRIAHGIVVFPGGVGTAEEILFLLGIKLHPDNAAIEMPLVFTGPAQSAAYFEQIDRLPAHGPRRRCRRALRDHSRRCGGSGAAHEAAHQGRAAPEDRAQRILQLPLEPAYSAGAAGAVPAHAREHGGAGAAPRPAPAPADRRAAPRLLGHRRRQRQGLRRARGRGARPVPAARRGRDRRGPRAPPRGLRARRAHED